MELVAASDLIFQSTTETCLGSIESTINSVPGYLPIMVLYLSQSAKVAEGVYDTLTFPSQEW